MKLLALVALTMTAFAANSLLARLALIPSDTGAASGPLAYAALRIVGGAVALAVIIALRSAKRPSLSRATLGPALWLTLYALSFAFAYLTLDAGAGALILFGSVQITMFTVAIATRQPLGWASFAGAALAFAGLCYLLWPGSSGAPDALGAVFMGLSGIAWGLYTLAGRDSLDPLGGTAIAFCLSGPVCAVVYLLWPDHMTWSGALYALGSGVVTSALGYALWYQVLPQITAASAAVAQLTVPILATLGGAVLLAEPLSLRFVLATGLVLSGVALTVLGQKRN